MLKPEIFTTKAINISSFSFYPRNYTPDYIFVKEKLNTFPELSSYIKGSITGGSTPPSYFFYKNNGIPFIKTAAVSRHLINVNDLQLIAESYHRKEIKRSIIHPYDIIYTMTGKFMGKAALCPFTIEEMNMSQNSVVLHCNSKEEAAFLEIYLNSDINRIQVRGTYSITKQKFMNQGKIASLKVINYREKYSNLMKEYLKANDNYYMSVKRISEIINIFNSQKDFKYSDTAQYGFVVKPMNFSKKMLLPNYYRNDIQESIDVFKKSNCVKFDKKSIQKGDEIGSINYLDKGIPFVKTSDIMNYDLNYEPDCYCSESFIYELSQNLKAGDIVFAKDGKPGEVAILNQNVKVVLSSGLVHITPRTDEERYWIFLLLASNYGNAYFKKWFVIAATMVHLRSDFFEDFQIPAIDEKIRNDFIVPLKKAFEKQKESFERIQKIKNVVELSYTDDKIKLEI